jgi:signal transduction histidine kinase
MLKKLQNRFILVTMVSVVIVLTIIMVSINIINYSKVNSYADSVLDLLIQNNGQFPLQQDQLNDVTFFSQNDRITGETQFETRYFTVIYDKSGNILVVDTVRITLVNEEEAVQYANEIMSEDDLQGYKDTYRYRVCATNEGTLIVFVDCAQQLINASDFLSASIWISCGGILGVFIIVLLLSKKIIQPIANSYQKQKHFITDSSHELKTPLTIISANNEIIELESGETESTRSISKQVDRMNSMVKSLTRLAKIDEKDALEEKVRFNLSDAVVDVVDMFIKTAKTKGKEMKSDIEENIDYNGDEKLIRQLVSILLDNAIKYSLSQINISLSKYKTHIYLNVNNDTNGIDKGNLDKCFDRFYRSDNMRASEIEGSGIGLSIAKEIVLLHKGKISAYSDDSINFNIKAVL